MSFKNTVQFLKVVVTVQSVVADIVLNWVE